MVEMADRQRGDPVIRHTAGEPRRKVWAGDRGLFETS